MGLLLASLLVFIPAVRAQDTNPVVVVMTADGPLTPAMVEYINRGLQLATDRQAQVIIIQLDTPGGDIGLMTTIEENLRSSQIPVVVYVSPTGAMAGSAGTIITLSGNLAAMAPTPPLGLPARLGRRARILARPKRPRLNPSWKLLYARLPRIAHRPPPNWPRTPLRQPRLPRWTKPCRSA